MDITPEWLRVYLSSGVCGNTVVRLATNRQRRHDAAVVAGDETIDLLSSLPRASINVALLRLRLRLVQPNEGGPQTVNK